MTTAIRCDPKEQKARLIPCISRKGYGEVTILSMSYSHLSCRECGAEE